MKIQPPRQKAEGIQPPRQKAEGRIKMFHHNHGRKRKAANGHVLTDNFMNFMAQVVANHAANMRSQTMADAVNGVRGRSIIS